MTPQEARELLDKATPGPWDCVGQDDEYPRVARDGYQDITNDATNFNAPLIAAAPALAELVANMHYEYAVATGPEHSPVYAAMNSQGRFIGTALALADWWQTKGEAQDLVDELRGENEHSTARIVRRLVSDPEVVE